MPSQWLSLGILTNHGTEVPVFLIWQNDASDKTNHSYTSLFFNVMIENTIFQLFLIVEKENILMQLQSILLLEGGGGKKASYPCNVFSRWCV